MIRVACSAATSAAGSGTPGFEWAGTHTVTQKREWPDWRPPAGMIARECANGRNLPVHMVGYIHMRNEHVVA